MKHLNCKISRVLVLYIILFSSAVTLCLTSIQLYLDYNDGIKTIHQRIDQIKLTNLDSIIQSLWTIDYSSVQIQLNGLTRINDIIHAELTDENNKVIAHSGEINTKNTITKTIQLKQIYRGTETSIGQLKLVATKENVYQQLMDTVVIILISQAIKTFLVSSFVLFIFYSMVTRHIEKITAHAENIKLKTRTDHLKLERNEKNLLRGDELERLVESINIMSDNIHDSYHELINSKHMLSDREAKFSAMFDSITDSIIFVDSNREIIQTNVAFEQQFGYSLNELKGKSTQLLYADPEQFHEQGKTRYNPLVTRKPSVYEIEYQRKDGSIFPSETMGGAVISANGSQLGFIGIIRDITHKKQAEEETKRLQKQLQQAQKMDAIGQLTGGIAHDFNNILASILGYSELMITLLEPSSDTKLKKYTHRIIQAGERARDLVSQLLAFSRSSPGVPEAVDLSELISEVLTLIRPTIASSIELEMKIDNDVPKVLMDITQMHQILMNLCINARDAMQGTGSLTVKLSTQHYDDTICNSCKELIHGDYVKLSVEDTGTGIDSEILDTIFDPFKSTKEPGEGTGMGLSVVHGILHKHMSHIIVDTQVGKGSSFQLLIPPHKETESVIPAEENIEEIVSHDKYSGARILIVDDEESVANFMKDLLENHNYNVTATTSSLQAIELIKHNPDMYDLIITDQTMPEMTGDKMIKNILEIRQNLPCILCSGYNDQVSEEGAFKLGISSYLSKPIKNTLLIKTIQEILSRE